MRLPHVRWLLAILWMALAALMFVMMDASSLRSWLYLAAIGLIPPAILLKLWHGDSRQTLAEMIRTERGR